MNLLWNLSLDQYMEVVELAIKNGKTAGQSIQEEFDVIVKKYNLKPLGSTEKDIDLLAGDLREEGIKVLNLKEKQQND